MSPDYGSYPSSYTVGGLCCLEALFGSGSGSLARVTPLILAVIGFRAVFLFSI